MIIALDCFESLSKISWKNNISSRIAFCLYVARIRPAKLIISCILIMDPSRMRSIRPGEPAKPALRVSRRRSRLREITSFLDILAQPPPQGASLLCTWHSFYFKLYFWAKLWGTWKTCRLTAWTKLWQLDKPIFFCSPPGGGYGVSAQVPKRANFARTSKVFEVPAVRGTRKYPRILQLNFYQYLLENRSKIEFAYTSTNKHTQKRSPGKDNIFSGYFTTQNTHVRTYKNQCAEHFLRKISWKEIIFPRISFLNVLVFVFVFV